MSAPKFSMCIIAKNEAQSLVNLLMSLADFRKRGGEVILLDTGSTDETIPVARGMGISIVKADPFQFSVVVGKETAKAINSQFVVKGELPVILTGTKIFNYGAARNFVDQFASNDIICIPDADEVFTALDVEAVDKLVDHGWNRFNIWFADNPTNKFFYDARWYDRRAFRWHGTMHETLQPVKGVVQSTTQVSPDICAMEHHQVSSKNRSNYLANLAYARYVDPDNERQVHCFARQLMYEHRNESAIAQFMEHALMKTCLESMT